MKYSKYDMDSDWRQPRHKCVVCGRVTETDLGCIYKDNFLYHCEPCHNRWIEKENKKELLQKQLNRAFGKMGLPGSKGAVHVVHQEAK